MGHCLFLRWRSILEIKTPAQVPGLNIMGDMPIITSLQNPRVKDAVRLRDRRHREKQGRILIDGARELRRAIEQGELVLQFQPIADVHTGVVGLVDMVMDDHVGPWQLLATQGVTASQAARQFSKWKGADKRAGAPGGDQFRRNSPNGQRRNSLRQRPQCQLLHRR